MTGIELIAKEREEQINKHGRTLEGDLLWKQHELTYVAGFLVHYKTAEVPNVEQYCPPTFDKEIFKKMVNKPYKERLIIAGALIAAELDVLNKVYSNE